ncbi:hypothetical protein LNKW23_36590 [Paralimibaculum aggregatum]|uniref:Uncharacterized protein n=1 Tax=Paralimibaculum aggregatum TaxID=3036245 RepID=A0ABQ6LRP4_9RHOB|nr:hypothetical protein LNKW23_36590 [Limibaculum sp. NKW23]
MAWIRDLSVDVRPRARAMIAQGRVGAAVAGRRVIAGRAVIGRFLSVPLANSRLVVVRPPARRRGAQADRARRTRFAICPGARTAVSGG